MHDETHPAAAPGTLNWRGRDLLIRPIVPRDEQRHGEFFSHLHAEDLRTRFFAVRREVPHAELLQRVNPDEATEVALVALVSGADGEQEEVATARAVSDRDNTEAELGIAVRSDLKHQGLGSLLLTELLARVKARGTPRIACEILRDNAPMRALARRSVFHLVPGTTNPGQVRYVLDL